MFLTSTGCVYHGTPFFYRVKIFTIEVLKKNNYWLYIITCKEQTTDTEKRGNNMRMNEEKFVKAIKEIDDTLDIHLCSIAWDCLKVAPHNNYAFTQLCAYIEMFGAKAGEDMEYFYKWADVKEWLKDHFYNN